VRLIWVTSFSLRRTSPRPVKPPPNSSEADSSSDPEPIVVPRRPPTSVFLRELFCAELVASAAWKMMTVRMSPGCDALRSPLSEAQLEPR
jgi:hypothetical protein